IDLDRSLTERLRFFISMLGDVKARHLGERARERGRIRAEHLLCDAAFSQIKSFRFAEACFYQVEAAELSKHPRQIRMIRSKRLGFDRYSSLEQGLRLGV